MATIYRKTDKGQTEIETRLYRLPPRLRTTLILVDGRRNDVELAKLIPADPEASLAALLQEGFIEAMHSVDLRIDVTAEPARTAPRAAAPTFAPTQPPAQAPGQQTTQPPIMGVAPRAFEVHRREAIKALTDQVGPAAETLAMRMEKCANWAQLLPVLQTAQQILRSSRGGTAAAEFSQRFIETPPG